MDWDNIVVIILWLVMAKWTIGVAYGIYLITKVNDNTSQWDWKDVYIVGPIFWVGWGLGRGIKWLSHTLKARRS